MPPHTLILQTSTSENLNIELTIAAPSVTDLIQSNLMHRDILE